MALTRKSKKKKKPVADVIATQASKNAVPKKLVHYHYDHKITFPGGVTVAGSSLDNLDRFTNPDWGLYADHQWRPEWRAEFITWRDFGLPANYKAAAEAIMDAYEYAANGDRVEVGCHGGHGRTGVILACMGVLAGLDEKDAIAFVRRDYCSQALETSEQEWWVEWFRCYLTDDTPSAKPIDWIAELYAQKDNFPIPEPGTKIEYTVYKPGKLPL